jgi:hypothetical protein
MAATSEVIDILQGIISELNDKGSKVNQLPPRDKTRIAPDGGWKSKALYLVEVSFGPTNPIHRALFFNLGTGGNPGGYNTVWSPCWEEPNDIHKLHYLRAVREIRNSGI